MDEECGQIKTGYLNGNDENESWAENRFQATHEKMLFDGCTSNMDLAMSLYHLVGEDWVEVAFDDDDTQDVCTSGVGHQYAPALIVDNLVIGDNYSLDPYTWPDIEDNVGSYEIKFICCGSASNSADEEDDCSKEANPFPPLCTNDAPI